MLDSSSWLRGVVCLAALTLASPLDLLVVRSLDGGATLGVLAVSSIAGLLGTRWAVRSWSWTALLVSLVNLPLAVYFGTPEAGAWASLFAIPKFLLFGVVGWLGWRSTKPPLLRWAGAVVPTVLLVLPFLIELALPAMGRGR